MPYLSLSSSSVYSFPFSRHNFIYNNNNELYSFGNNRFGQLGLGDIENRNKPTLLLKDKIKIKLISIGKSHSLIYKGITLN